MNINVTIAILRFYLTYKNIISMITVRTYIWVRVMQRWIIHVDMDAFFASVEQRDNPVLRGKPVIIGGVSNRGVVSTASYEARRFGVRSAMSMVEARRRCPQGVVLPPDHDKYVAVSTQIKGIMDDYSPLVEPLSLDEAFLDVTGMELLYPNPVDIAREIKSRIKNEIGITASAGVAPNKFLAKLASDLRKPDGLTVVRPGEVTRLLAKLPVGRLWGVGEATAAILVKLGITTIGQLAVMDSLLLERHCGRAAYDLQRLARGQDDRPVIPWQPPKSFGNENTYEQDLFCREDMETELLALASKIGWRLRLGGYTGRTITLKLRFASFRTLTRSRTLADPTNIDETIYATAKELLAAINLSEGVRLLGVAVSNLATGGEQISLFAEPEDKRQAIHQAVDKLRARFGADIVTRGRLLK